MKGLLLTPEVSMFEAPPLDVLLVPGGVGVNAAMEDNAVMEFIRQRALMPLIVQIRMQKTREQLRRNSERANPQPWQCQIENHAGGLVLLSNEFLDDLSV